jgi:hypothetical protein
MGASTQQIERDRREGREDRFHERLASDPMLPARSMNAAEQLGCGDGGDPDDFAGTKSFLEASAHFRHRGRSRASAQRAFELDEDRCV